MTLLSKCSILAFGCSILAFGAATSTAESTVIGIGSSDPAGPDASTTPPVSFVVATTSASTSVTLLSKVSVLFPMVTPAPVPVLAAHWFALSTNIFLFGPFDAV